MRKNATENPGSLAITIDLEPESVHTHIGDAGALNRVTDWLLEAFARHSVRATWAVADPVHSAVSGQIAAHLPGHEIAVLGDASWVGEQAGRSRFARELSRRFLGARNSGIAASSLVPRVAVDGDHYDLLMKLGITAVSEPTHTSRAPADSAPQAVRYGVWQIGIQHALTDHSVWRQFAWIRNNRFSLRRRIRQTASSSQVFHLFVSAARLSELGGKSLNSLDRVLRLVERMSERQRLEIVTLSQIADRLSEVPKTSPARSILRPAG